MTDLALGTIRQRLNSTGIGFAGVDGVWWQPACEPFTLPTNVSQQLAEIGPALFRFFDVIVDLYSRGASNELAQMLDYKVPDTIPRLVSAGHLDSLRPDFQLRPVPGNSLSFQLVATELEVCPSAHGFAHAMQFAYGLPLDLVDAFASYLDGRDLLFVGTQAWSEFLFEQLAFCRALADSGASGRVLYDLPLSILANEARRGQRWQPPLFGIPRQPPDWNDDVTGRIQRHHLEPYLWPGDDRWPDSVGETVIFRFGYFDCFPASKLHQINKWQEGGARLLNPLTFFLENKAIMAALNLPDVRRRIDAPNLAVLDRCIPKTILITPENRGRVLAKRREWVVKYAAFDGGDQAWGGRSLEFGPHHSEKSWQAIVDRYLALPWPAVAQRITITERLEMDYWNREGIAQSMVGDSRLRVFFLRQPPLPDQHRPQSRACGAHITLSSSQGRVSEGLAAVQAPVIFADSGR